MILGHFTHNNKYYAGEGLNIRPRVITHFWLRRLSEATLFAGIIVLALYALAKFGPASLNISLGEEITDNAAIAAGILSAISLVFCFWQPKKQQVMVSLALYLLAAIMVSVLIFTSGGFNSPFVGAWLIIAIFAGYFGLGITGIMALLVAAQTYLTHADLALDPSTIVTYLIYGLTPLTLSFILWHRQPEKKSDNSLRDLANRLSTAEGKSDVVINTIEDGVMSIDRKGMIDLINPSAQALVGWNKGDALGLDWRSVLKLVTADGREVPEIDNPVTQALSTYKPAHSDKLSLMTGSERKRLISITTSPIGQGDGGVIVVFRDITKEKAEEREQAEFISTASHEMRTPVASIEGYLGLALNPATAQIDEKAREYITKAHESARHLGELFQNLLDISQSEDGRLKYEAQVVDVSAMTADIFESLGPIAEQKQLHYFFKPNPSLESDSAERKLQPVFYAHVDGNHLREVVSNLIENAIKYTHQGDVTVDVTGDEDIVTISVQDTGIGIPAEDIPHLFQKFYRVDNSDTREIGGTGLGLYLCRRLAEAMGGSIRVESEYKKGSTFLLDIPRISHEEAMQKLSELPEKMPQFELQQGSPLTETLNADMQPQINPITPVIQPIDDRPLPKPQPQISDQPNLEVSTLAAMPTQAPTLADIEAAVVQQPPATPHAHTHAPPAQSPPQPSHFAAPAQSSHPPQAPVHHPQPPQNPGRQTQVDVPPRPQQ